MQTGVCNIVSCLAYQNITVLLIREEEQQLEWQRQCERGPIYKMATGSTLTLRVEKVDDKGLDTIGNENTKTCGSV